MGLLILLRHGQAALGADDYDALSDLGRQQAALAATRLAGGAIPDRIHAGSLTRQQDTAFAVLHALGLPRERLVIDPRWDEYDHIGVLAAHTGAVRFETTRTSEDRRALQDALDEAISRWATSGAQQVESHDAFVDRVLAAAADLAAQPGVSLAATSGGVIAVIAARHLGLPVGDWPRLAALMVNTGMTRLITGRDTGTRVLTFNDHAHLEADRQLISYR